MNRDGSEMARAAELLRQARHVVVFSGAGVSAESGIATFRDAGGVWEEFPPERFATLGGLMKTAASDPPEFARFLLAVVEPIARAEPNAAHRAAAELERHVQVTVITQNIDALHTDAGSTVVHEVHGSLFDIVSLRGRFLRRLTREQMRELASGLREAMANRSGVTAVMGVLRPMLGLGIRGAHRPNVVLFGEGMAEPAWTLAQEAVRECDCMISVGTSGVVMPAAMLPMQAQAAGAALIEINPECSGDADHWLQGSADEQMPALVQHAFEAPGGSVS